MPTPAEFISFIEVPNLNPTVSPTYYYMTDPGKEGLWKYDSSDQSGTANIGTILAISTSPTSRVIKRIFDGAVVVTWFGAIGDGTTDNYSKIKNAIETCCTLDITTLEFPPGNYMVDRGDPTTDFIAITKNLHLKGNQAILNVDTSGNTYPNLGAASNRKFLTATGLTSLTLSGIIFKWTTKLNSALSTLSYGPYDPSFLFVVSSSNIKISKCEFYFAGIDFDDSSDIVIEGCVLKNGWNNTTYHAGAKLGNGLGNIRFKQIHLDFNELQENVFIRDNIFYNVVNAFYSSNINNLVFHRNKIEKTADTAVFDRCISQKKPSRRDISHNIFKDIGKSAIKTLDANNDADTSGNKAFGSCALVSFNIIENWGLKKSSAAILSANNYVTEDNDSSYQEVSDFSKRSSQLNIIGNIISETESTSCGLLFQIINTKQVIIAENNVSINGLYDSESINKICTYCNDVVISNNIFKTQGTFGIKRCDNVRIANNHFIAGNNGTT